jgi:hypothetical protein
MRQTPQQLKARATYQVLEKTIATARKDRLKLRLQRLDTRIASLKKSRNSVINAVLLQDARDSRSYYKGELKNLQRFIKRIR